MKNKQLLKTLLVFILGLSVVFSNALAVLAQDGTDANSNSINSLDVKVTIHKLQADSYHTKDGIENLDGEEISDFKEIGTNVQPLQNVTFTYYEISKAQFESGKAPDKSTLQDGKIIGTTNEMGEVVWNVKVADISKPQYYAVYETGTPTPNPITGAVAVPFVIAFPMTNSLGSDYLTDVHIYPKNITGAFPVIGKDIVKLGQNEASFDVGESFKYFLKGTIPTNISSYTQYTFKDTLDSALSFDETVVPSINVGGTPLTPAQDYEFSREGQEITFKITSEGISKIAKQMEGTENRQKVADNEIADIENNTHQKPFIEVTFNAFLNNSASVNTKVTNSATITYNNGSLPTAEVSASDSVSVYYGNKVFKKVNSGKEGLSNAHFELRNNNSPMLWTQALIDINQANSANASKFHEVAVDKPIIMVSDNNGDFAIKGLAYSDNKINDISKAYTVVEIKAPEGYQKLTKPESFTVDANSNTTITEITNNKRPIIPATGGMGTVIFIVAGVFLMAFAIYGRRKAKEEA